MLEAVALIPVACYGLVITRFTGYYHIRAKGMPSQTLHLSQSQQQLMILAPQLRQSLEMLQLPILELRQMIQQEIEQNPTLEETPLLQESVEIEPEAQATDEQKEMDFKEEFEVLARLDDEWRDYFFQNEGEGNETDRDEKRQFMFDSIEQRESLQEHLLQQLALSELGDDDRRIAEMIIGSINNDGYLASPLEELAEAGNTDPRHLEDVLAVVQDFHPTGVGARNLRECLLRQLERMTVSNNLAYRIVRDHLDRLGAHKLQEIARALHCGVEEVQAAAELIGTLDPKPGRLYSDDVVTYVLPEIVVRKIEGKWTVILNDDQLPHLRISRHYRGLLENPETPAETRTYIQERIRAGAFMIKSIHQRQKTIQRIATEIVDAQVEFLEHGISHLRPLTMAEIAGKVGVHETTVSRAVSGKYMRSPRGMFELKYFFTPGIKTAGGEQVSNKTVKDIIAAMVAEEDPAQPLSDQQIMDKLKEDGIEIARRTVAKYRLMLKIPPSHMRKRY